ncbi:MAG TPA: ATP-binding protein [Chitinophagaceae bacterium]|nr:ATP-binding protein [Chitinophagaceae bacterium]
MLDAKIIRENFDPKLITALFKNFSSPYIALFELIDNAVDDRHPDEKLIVSINYNSDDAKLSIKNFNGKGMTIEDLEKFFTWGYSEKATGRIGRYGQGGKAALGYLAKSFTIKSHAKKNLMGFCVMVKDWENREVGFKDGFEVTAYQSLKDEGDVSFEIFGLKKEFDVDTIIKRIKKTYRPLITHKKVDFTVEGKSVKVDPIIYVPGTHKKFPVEISWNGRKLTMNGEYGLVDDPKSDRGGFRIFQYGRNVAEKEYFGHTDPSKRWNVERLYGELYIDFDLPLSMNKTEIDRDSELWLLIERKMYQTISEIMKEAVDYKKPTEKESKSVDSFNKKLNKATDKKSDTKFDLTNYGPRLLFKIEEGKNGESTVKINRDHRAYKLWSDTELGKKYYSVLMYALTETTKKMSNAERTKFLNDFSEYLGKKSAEILE